MVLPLIIAGVAGVTGGMIASDRLVKKAQDEAILAAKVETVERIEKEIEYSLKQLEYYNYKSKLEMCFIFTCFFVILTLIFFPNHRFLAEWVIILILGRAMYLTAYSFAVYFNNPDIKKFTNLLWKNWAIRKPRFQFENALNSTLRKDLRDRVDNKEVWNQINNEVNEKIKSLSTVSSIGYTIFGDSKEIITNRIQNAVLNEVDYGHLVNSASHVLKNIVKTLIIYSLTAFFFRIFIHSGFSGIQYWVWLILTVIFFVFWYFIHVRTMNSGQRT